MRVLLPAHEARSGGLGSSIRGLVEHLPRALGPEDELVVVGAPGADGGWQRPGRRFARFFHEQVRLARKAREVDLVHLPDHRPILASRTPVLLTVYDVLYLDHPEWFPGPVGRYKRLMLRRAIARKPAMVVTGSSYTRERLLHWFPSLDPARVRAVYPGIATPGWREDAGAGDYFLTVATIEPRKNHARLLRAFRAARAHGLALDWKVVGAPGYSAAAILDELEAEPGVEVLGWVGDEELERLYAGAVFTAYPSLGEGFGFPPLEAMARGVPVLSASGSALDETVGQAALRVDPTDVDAWTEALLRLGSDEAEQTRLRAAGLAWSARFDWPSCAAEYVRAYRDALA